MRITILQGAFLPVPPLAGGAVEKLWFQLGKEFTRCGHTVVQISRTYPGLPNVELIDDVTHIRIRGFDMPQNGLLLKLYDFFYSIQALRVLPPADILVTNTFFMPLLQRSCLPSVGRLVVSVERMPKNQLSLYRHVSALRCCSTAVYERALEQSPCLLSKAVVIPNPLPFQPISSPFSNTKSHVILFCGRLHPEKGIELLLRAFILACQNGLAGWTLRIVGPFDTAHGGGGLPYYRRLLGIANLCTATIDWVGPLFDDLHLINEYLNASIFVYPSLAEDGEASPLAPLEAMAHGAVPIVSSLRCFSDYLTPGYNGLVFNHRAHDPVAELSRALLDLAHNTSYRESLASHAISVRSTHNSSLIANHMIELFKDLLHGRTPAHFSSL